MRPILFSIGSFQVASYFFIIMIGVLATTFWDYRLCRRNGLKSEVALDFGMIGMVAGILGARIFHILVEYPAYYWESPMRVFYFWQGGFVSWGAFLGVPLALIAYIRLRRLPFWAYMDMAAAGMPLVKLAVRIGCLLKGCCFGKPTTLWWGIRFTQAGSDGAHYFPGIPLHPTQVLNIIHAIILFFVINRIYKRRTFEGQTFSLLILLWVIPRALIEFLRGDADRGLYLGGLISTGQVMAIGLSIFAIILYRVKSKNRERTL